jgi:hypothetical protein
LKELNKKWWFRKEELGELGGDKIRGGAVKWWDVMDNSEETISNGMDNWFIRSISLSLDVMFGWKIPTFSFLLLYKTVFVHSSNPLIDGVSINMKFKKSPIFLLISFTSSFILMFSLTPHISNPLNSFFLSETYKSRM